MLKNNFESCEAGRSFLVKTGPLWDSLTQCIYRKSLVLLDMIKSSYDTMLEAYKKQLGNETSVVKRSWRRNSVGPSFLESLITGLLL